MPATAPARTTTVASVPSGHPYVRRLTPASGPEGHDVVRLPDPPPLGVAVPAPGQWWPPAMLGEAWVDAHASGIDVFHLHFGFDAVEPARLARVIGALRRHGVPLVYTVHDLRNPHHRDRTAHDAQLDVLVPAADALVTLTPGAADEIARRWGRTAQVVPHPHVVPLATMRSAATAREVRARGDRGTDRPFRVGLTLKGRASVAAELVVPTLVETVAGLPGAVLLVDTQPGVDLPPYVRGCAEAGLLELRVRGHLPDEELFAHLAGLDVSVLPYRFGTHSGWLEACRDVGTTVVAPSCGYFAEQGPVLGYTLDEDGYDPDTLAHAVRRAHAERPAWGATLEERRRQRAVVAAAHDDLYRRLVQENR